MSDHTILFTDVAQFSSPIRTDEDRAHIRDGLWEATHHAFLAVMDPSDWSWQDRGDGMLILIKPNVPLSRVIAGVGNLSTEIRDYNEVGYLGSQIQLRVAVHQGPIQYDAMGPSSEAIIYAARLVEVPALKKAMAATNAFMGLIVSDEVHKNLGYNYLRVRAKVKETYVKAYMTLSGSFSDRS